MTIEYRYLRKAKPDVTDDGKLTGRAWPYGSPTQIGSGPYGFREVIRKGAGKKSINDGDIVLLDNHESRLPLARMSAGTLTMRDGAQGGDWEADIVDTTYGNDVRKNVKAKNYGGCSFGFEVIRDKWTDDQGNPATPMDGTNREILEMKVHEVSICTFPAYGDGATSVSTKEMIRAARGLSPEDERAASTTAPGNVGVPAPGKGVAGGPSYNSSGDSYTIETDAGDVSGAEDDDSQDAADMIDMICPSCQYEAKGATFCQSCGDVMRAVEGRSSRGGNAPGDGSKPYGDVTYADPGYQSDKKKRYPLDTKEHAKAAWSYINKAKNAAKYTASQLASIKSKIKAALSKFGVKTSDAEQNMAEWEALCDFREMTEGWDGESREYDGGVLPDGVVSTEDVNWIARDIKAANSTEARVEIIARAADMGIAEVLPDRWDGNGGIGLDTDEDVKRDMDEIYTIALNMAPTTAALRILDLAQAYLTEDLKEKAERVKETPDLEQEEVTLTLAEARQRMEEAEQRRRQLSR